MANIGKMAAQMTLDSVGFEKGAAKSISAMERMQKSVARVKQIVSAFGAAELLGKVGRVFDFITSSAKGEAADRINAASSAIEGAKSALGSLAAESMSRAAPAVEALGDALKGFAELSKAAQDAWGGFVDSLVRGDAAATLQEKTLNKMMKSAGSADIFGMTGSAIEGMRGGPVIGGMAGLGGSGNLGKMLDEINASVRSKRLDAMGLGPNMRKVMENFDLNDLQGFKTASEAAEAADREMEQMAESINRVKNATKEWSTALTSGPIQQALEAAEAARQEDDKFKSEVQRAMGLANRFNELASPSAIMSGSAEAFSAINRFNHQQTGKASIEDVRKVLEEQRNIEKEQKRILEEMLKALKDPGVTTVTI